MKNVKRPKVSDMIATHELNGLVEYGRKLHSEAVFMALLKMFRLNRPHRHETVQNKEEQRSLKYSHELKRI